MKKVFFILMILCFSSFAFSQVIIGTGKSALTNTSVSLEFGTENKGLLLPWVDAAASVTSPAVGTMIFDSTDKKVKVKLTSSWMDLTVDTSGVVGTTPAFSSEKTNAKVSIGTPTTTPGILVLEDNNKAMIIPTVAAYTDIVNPSPGMMVYLSGVKEVAFFNGTVWTFWKP